MKENQFAKHFFSDDGVVWVNVPKEFEDQLMMTVIYEESGEVVEESGYKITATNNYPLEDEIVRPMNKRLMIELDNPRFEYNIEI